MHALYKWTLSYFDFSIIYLSDDTAYKQLYHFAFKLSLYQYVKKLGDMYALDVRIAVSYACSAWSITGLRRATGYNFISYLEWRAFHFIVAFLAWLKKTFDFIQSKYLNILLCRYCLYTYMVHEYQYMQVFKLSFCQTVEMSEHPGILAWLRILWSVCMILHQIWCRKSRCIFYFTYQTI